MLDALTAGRSISLMAFIVSEAAREMIATKIWKITKRHFGFRVFLCFSWQSRVRGAAHVKEELGQDVRDRRNECVADSLLLIPLILFILSKTPCALCSWRPGTPCRRRVGTVWTG